MKAKLNEQVYSVPGECETIGDLLELMQDSVPSGHVVVRILVDGEELEDTEGSSALDMPCGGIDEVEFFSARAIDLAREGLQQAVQILPQLVDVLREAAHKLRRGETVVGLDMLYEGLSQIEWYLGLIGALDIYFTELAPGFDDEDGLARLADGLEPPALPEMRTFASVENLRGRLVEAQRLQVSEAFGPLANLLEHDLLPIVKLWQREAPMLLRRVNREGAQA